MTMRNPLSGKIDKKKLERIKKSLQKEGFTIGRFVRRMVELNKAGPFADCWGGCEGGCKDSCKPGNK